MIEFNIFKRFNYKKSGGMSKQRKKVYFNKTYLTLFKLHIAIPIKDNLKNNNINREDLFLFIDIILIGLALAILMMVLATTEISCSNANITTTLLKSLLECS